MNYHNIHIAHVQSLYIIVWDTINKSFILNVWLCPENSLSLYLFFFFLNFSFCHLVNNKYIEIINLVAQSETILANISKCLKLVFQLKLNCP